MDFIEIAKKRYSVRSYKDKKVEEEKLQKILEAAHVAPTAANLQPVRLIVVQSSEGLAKIGKGANLYGAPLAVIVCADHGKAWVRPFDKKQTTDIDASILTDHMMLQATESGLGSVWICYFKPDGYAGSSGCRMIWSRSISLQSDIQMRKRQTRNATHSPESRWKNWYLTKRYRQVFTT